MDSKFLQDFLAQAESQLSTIRGGILVCAREGNRHGELQTSLHQAIAIKEAAVNVNETEIVWKAEELEKQLEAFVSIKTAPPDEQSRELLDKLTELEILIAQIHFNADSFPESIADFIDDSFDNLLSGKNSETEVIEETEDSWDEEFEIDEEMLEIFAGEADELVQSIVTNLKTLEETPNDREALLEIRRNAHTLKGSAGIVGLKELSGVAHRVEDLLDYLAENEIEADRKIFKILSDSTDCFTALANGETSTQLTKKIAQLYKQFDKLISALKKSTTQTPADASSDTILETPAPINFENEPADAAALPSSQSRSVVRVSLDKLNDLVKITSGLVTSRSIFEQRLAELEQQIGELHNSTRRLQRSTGKLETDFEADMLNTAGRASSFILSPLLSSETIRSKTTVKGQWMPDKGQATDAFDSLELDRYSDFHQTMRELAETTGDTAAINTELDNVRGSLELLFENQRRLIEEMQEKLLRLRLVSFESLKVRLQRTVRVACDEEGKAAQLTTEGETLEVDTQILDSLIEPLLHLLRNAVAHGIEPPETRRLLGKPEVGKIHVQVKSEETHIILKISDDGRGIFADGLKEKAVRNGLITGAQAERMSRDEAFSLIFLPGLTTADKISQIAGRGVGMNIVKQNIARQKGTIAIESEMQKGTTFTIRLPITMAITRALLVKSGEQVFAFPLKIVKQASEIFAAEYEQTTNKNRLQIGSVNYAVFYLSKLLGLPNQKTKNEKVSLLLLENLETPCALIVDEIYKAEEIVIKQLGNPLQNLAELLGATILGDGSVVPVLDLVHLLNQEIRNPQSAIRNPRTETSDNAPTNGKSLRTKNSALNILIVDDSPSVRHLTSNIIKNAGWTVTVAKDGLEALEILQESRELPDAILSDVEMPRMDGYEFLSSLKRQENLRTIPVVMITSRANQKHRQKAFDLGVSEYLTKPFDDAKLINIIGELTG
jgi:chemosensory pili system protein ChpA (sensor histidine kinase/response regulator)